MMIYPNSYFNVFLLFIISEKNSWVTIKQFLLVLYIFPFFKKKENDWIVQDFFILLL